MDFLKAKVEITAETHANYQILMGYFRFNGLLPVSVRREGPKLFLQFSPLYLSLWLIFSGFFIATTFWGMVVDAQNKSDSSQIEADTDKIMFLMQAAQYSGIVIVGTLVNPCKIGQLFKYISCINKVDLVIKTAYKKSERNKLMVLATILTIFNVIFGTYFVYSCYLVYGDTLSLIEVVKRYSSLQVVTYSAWVTQYMFVVLVKSLETRIGKLNEVLATTYNSLASTSSRGPNKTCFGPKRRRSRSVEQEPTMMVVDKSKNDCILSLTKVYLELLDAADTLNDFLNLGFLITTAAVFWSLIYILYFFMLEMAHARGDQARSAELISVCTQVVGHSVRALMIVNPVHDCLLEVQSTKGWVSKMLACNLSVECRRQVHDLAIVLGLRELQFSACGFLTIDRLLLASMVDTITTILMVFYDYRSTFIVDF